MFHAWKDGMSDWKRVYEIEELKHLILGIYHSFQLLLQKAKVNF
jgi:hypothetical protein